LVYIKLIFLFWDQSQNLWSMKIKHKY
jgi:hypothetical protein